MQLRIERRAEIAMRSLQPREQSRIERAADDLRASEWVDLLKSPKLKRLTLISSGRKLYSYQTSPKLRLVLSLDDETCVLEDVVDHDRLDKLSRIGARR